MPKFFAELGLLFFALVSPLLLWTLFDGENTQEPEVELSSESPMAKVKAPSPGDFSAFEGHWVKAHVESLQKKKALPSLEEALYPDAELTRIQALEWIEAVPAFSSSSSENEESLALASLALESLTDVASLPEKHPLLLRAFENNWIQAPANGLFRPYEKLTRAEALALLMAVFKKETLSTVIPNFADVAPYEDWFASMTAFALREGWSSGENFEPQRPIRRAEFLKWLDLALPPL